MTYTLRDSLKIASAEIIHALSRNHVEIAKLMDQYGQDLKHYAPYLVPLRAITFEYRLNSVTAYIVIIKPNKENENHDK